MSRLDEITVSDADGEVVSIKDFKISAEALQAAFDAGGLDGVSTVLQKGADAISDPNLGGTVEFDWGWVKLVPAWHTNTIPGSDEAPFSAEHGISIGVPAGLLINIGGATVYHAGDTCLFGDMRLIAERNPIDVALLPIGGHYTMDRNDAVVAAELVGAPTVIPMHYDTFINSLDNPGEAIPTLAKSIDDMSRVVVLKIGERRVLVPR